ncbi:MAG: hypothetical protein C1943_07600 [Halochromatium sp.]|nr:hypothetical protein [Halochromatium sp.]
MPFDARKNLLVADTLLSVEDAEVLLEWLLKNPRGRINLSACTHLHTANLQVLMAARPKISVWPTLEPLAEWLKTALDKENKDHAKNDTGR